MPIAFQKQVKKFYRHTFFADNEIRETVDENYTLVSKFLSEYFYNNVNHFLETLLEKHGYLFKNTDATFEKVGL